LFIFHAANSSSPRMKNPAVGRGITRSFRQGMAR
jgi:hypothetical protein